MNIGEVMTPGVQVIGPDESLVEAARIMKERNIGSLLVSENGNPIGMITDRDICIRSVSGGDDPESTPVCEIMTTDVVCSYHDQSLDEAARIMREKKIRRLLVVDRNEKMMGVLSLGDIVARDKRIAGDILEGISNHS